MTELATFNVLASTGSAGSESQAWAPVAVTKSGSTYLTGKYWPAADPSYHFYASNAALTFAAAGSTVIADGSTDVVCAYLPSPTYGEPNALTFDHIYARVGSFSVATQSGYEISAVSATLKNGVSGGTYNLRTGAWSGLSAASDRACASFSGSTSSQSSSNDIWLVPGTYTIRVSYTLTKGEYVVSFTKTGSVTLVAGKTNNISTTAVGGSASEIVFSVSLTSWSPNSVALDMSYGGAINLHPFTVASGKVVYFAKSNLQYQASTGSWRLAQYPWSYVGNAAGNTTATASRPTDSNWIDLFGWGASGYNSTYPYLNTQNNADYAYPGAATDIAGTNYDWGRYCAIASYDGSVTILAGELRTLTKSEWEYLYSHATGYARVNGINGMILFSDDYADPAACPTKAACAAAMQNVTSAQWALMDAAGAVFLPAAGCRPGSSVYDAGSFGFYWSSTAYDVNTAYCFTFNEGEALANLDYSRSSGLSVRLVKD